MVRKNGFAFIETIITIVILSASLLYLYNGYSSIINVEKDRLYYDDISYIYKANYVRKFLLENSDIEKLKSYSFDNTYVTTIGTGFTSMFNDNQKNDGMINSLENIVQNFNINQMLLIKSNLLNDCIDDSDICNNSLDNLSYSLKEYVYSINDTGNGYYLIFEFAEKYNDEGSLEKCIPGVDTRCNTYYVSLDLGATYLGDYIIGTYKGDGEKGLYLHDSDLANGAEDNSYRFAGANPDNYVCFGSDEENCPEDNLYRIIGVFDGQVKLIKADVASKNLLGENGNYYGIYEWPHPNYKGLKLDSDLDGYYWLKPKQDETNVNSWLKSDLNNINLNTNYLKKIGNKWANKISNHTWNVGGINNEVFLNKDYMLSSQYFKEYYDLEIGINGTGKEVKYSAKIGLLYVSDYLYSSILDKNFQYNNWISIGIGEHTISRHFNNNDGVYVIEYYNEIGYEDSMENKYIIRPVFYLKNSTKYISGSGTKEKPIRID